METETQEVEVIERERRGSMYIVSAFYPEGSRYLHTGADFIYCERRAQEIVEEFKKNGANRIFLCRPDDNNMKCRCC